MILVAVIVGYMLGIIPFILPKILNNKQKYIEQKEYVKKNKTQEEILDEWLNGPKSRREVNQEDIYEEYITGQEVKKGD